MEIDSKLRLHFLNLYCMVIADGIVDPKELETIYRIGRENYGLSEEEINKAVVGAGTTYVIPESTEERIRILYEMAIIAWADGKIEDSERKMLRDYALRYGIVENTAIAFVDYLLEKAHNNISVEDIINELEKTDTV